MFRYENNVVVHLYGKMIRSMMSYWLRLVTGTTASFLRPVYLTFVHLTLNLCQDVRTTRLQVSVLRAGAVFIR